MAKPGPTRVLFRTLEARQPRASSQSYVCVTGRTALSERQSGHAYFSTSQRCSSAQPGPSSASPESSPPITIENSRTGRSILEPEEPELRLPRSVQLSYLKPLRRKAKYGLPCCDLQLRSYNVSSLELGADFAMRTAYYLNLPTSGPIPLPKMISRWTVPRSHFIFKKSQENWERITYRRMIQIQDGHQDVIDIWLAFLRKHQVSAVGLKANFWHFDTLGVAEKMDAQLPAKSQALESIWARFGRRKEQDPIPELSDLLVSEKHRAVKNTRKPEPLE